MLASIEKTQYYVIETNHNLDNYRYQNLLSNDLQSELLELLGQNKLFVTASHPIRPFQQEAKLSFLLLGRIRVKRNFSLNIGNARIRKVLKLYRPHNLISIIIS